MTEPSFSTKKRDISMAPAGRGYQARRYQQDVTEFRERMCQLADNLAQWLAGREVSIILQERAPARNTAATWTVPVIVLRHGRNYAGFTPQTLYCVKGDTQLKGEVQLAVDNPCRSPRTEKYLLYMAGHLLSTADWAVYNAGRVPGRGQVLTRERALAVLAPLFDVMA